MNKNLVLYIPELKDYWYEQKLQADIETMSYNAGYDVCYAGYHYDTGCIDFPKSNWLTTYERRINQHRFFAYIKDIDLNQFVGYCNYQYNTNENRYECGIVIEGKYRHQGYGQQGLMLLLHQARKDGIEALYDNFEMNRGNTLSMFLDCGFEIVKKTTWKKFGKDVSGAVVKIKL